MTQQAYTIAQFVSIFQVGRTKLFAEIAAGRLPTYKLGRRTFISAKAATEWQQRLEDEAKLAKEGAGVPA
ncbi:prophage CP4-57 regulatory [Hydrogenophaga taeniospiralis CCUG 15921]|uniref:Prophage CP4-57 regulatory n=1 Tax=Hydrogenophaga taeniospiralis CCUG 15921 TaxID=1281780 RepID=A0A9X4S6I5_9BURK|nr:hypothetical protein [Hydrogenophaga taeniospiralis]MDG5973727.1 prophage CP4-57 regulatory [Hydrogenophaga taeniospiralis CCUG 15921]